MHRETIKQEVQASILDAAERLLMRYGYGKMTMSDLAEEAGIGVGTTYLHFSAKSDVALAVVARANLRVVAEQKKIAASHAPVSARLREVLTQRILIRFEGACHHKHTIQELRAALRQQKDLREQSRLWRDQEIQIVAALLMEGRASGMFDVEDTVETAEALLWATDVFHPKNLTPLDFEAAHLVPERVSRVVDLLLRAVTRREPNA